MNYSVGSQSQPESRPPVPATGRREAPAPGHLPLRRRWELAIAVGAVLYVLRGLLWSPLFASSSGLALVLSWAVLTAAVLAASLAASPWTWTQVRRGAWWLVALVVADTVWHLMLVPAPWIGVAGWLGAGVAALATCAAVTVMRRPARAWWGVVVAALTMVLLQWGLILLSPTVPGTAVGAVLGYLVMTLALFLAIGAGVAVGHLLTGTQGSFPRSPGPG